MELTYKNENGINITVTISEDSNLTEVFAKFVEFTRMVGYQEGSWATIIQKLNDDGGFNDRYTIYEWAAEKIYS